MLRTTRVLYDGPSKIDGKPIVVVASCINVKSENAKTGDVIQTHILVKDEHPGVARKKGLDVSVCGNCPGRKHGKDRDCYVILCGESAAWVKQKAGEAPQILRDEWKLFANKPVRLGTYGNPSAMPFKLAMKIAKSGLAHLGYDFRWRTIHKSWSKIVMASVRSLKEKEEAKAKGFRTFRQLSPNEKVLPGELLCPASKEAKTHGKIQCADCLLCCGTWLRGKLAKLDPAKIKDIAIYKH